MRLLRLLRCASRATRMAAQHAYRTLLLAFLIYVSLPLGANGELRWAGWAQAVYTGATQPLAAGASDHIRQLASRYECACLHAVALHAAGKTRPKCPLRVFTGAAFPTPAPSITPLRRVSPPPHLSPATGQGYIPPASFKLGATEVKQKVLSSQLAQAVNLQQAFARSKQQFAAGSPCARGAGGSLCGARGGDVMGAAAVLKMAMSPAAFSAADPQLTGGLQLLTAPEDQGECNTCTALSVAAIAQAAVAAALRRNASEVSLSPADLYFCSPDERRTCSAGWGLRAGLVELQQRAAALRTAKCLPYGRAAAAAEVSGTKACEGPCADVAPLLKQGRFKLVPISNDADAQSHIRLSGGVATSFTLYPVSVGRR